MNLSKKRKFPSYQYAIYKLNKFELGKFLNTWFWGEDFIDKRKKAHKTNQLWTVKEVDSVSASHLYNRRYHPISLKIIDSYRSKTEGNQDLIARIHSPDDSSYGAWFVDLPTSLLEQTRMKLVKYIDEHKILNGEKFLEFCQTLGATDLDYN